jgi:hypothetical protein
MFPDSTPKTPLLKQAHASMLGRQVIAAHDERKYFEGVAWWRTRMGCWRTAGRTTYIDEIVESKLM